MSEENKVLNFIEEIVEELFSKEVEKLINPLVTGSAYGSFKFSIANDFLSREGEKQEVLELNSLITTLIHRK